MADRPGCPAPGGRPIAARLRRLVYLCWAILLLVLVGSVVSIRLQSAEIRALTQVQSPAVEANGQVLQAMTDAQAGLNGYELSGDRAMLAPYVGAHDRALNALATVEARLAQGVRSHDDSEQDLGLQDQQRVAVERWWAHGRSAEQILSRGGRTDVRQGRALFDRFRVANAAMGAHLTDDLDQTRLAAGQVSSRVELGSIAGTLAALVVMLALGGRVARNISQPMVELRDTMVRQRGGDSSARARLDQGSRELRSVARDFNALTDQNLDLLRIQGRAVAIHELTIEIENSIRVVPDTQQTLSLLCAALGDGLGVDRVIAHTLDNDHEVLLSAQWHLPALPHLGEMSPDLLGQLGGLPSQVWISTGVRVLDDLEADFDAEPEAEVQLPERGRSFQRETGARAVIMAPIGLGDRIIGMIYVLMVDGSRRWTGTEANAVQQVAGFVAGAIVEAEYRANQSEHVERLERLDRQKNNFLATVSHELRTPLTSISGYLEMLQDGDAGELTVEQAGMLEVIERNTARLTGLIEDLLVLNRIESGETEGSFVGLSMRQLILAACLELSSFAGTKGIELDIDAGLESVMVHGDRRSLDRAILNIVANAIKFSRPGGVVTITCTLDQSRSRAIFCCQDRGIGIPAEDQLQLFTRFYRGKNATEQVIPGTGLGLSIAKRIVDEHGGVLRLTSMEGEGTTVVMELPLVTLTSRPGADGNDSPPVDVFRIRA